MKSIVSVVKEKMSNERRVILTPEGVSLLVKDGFTVYIEENAGADCGYLNEDYEREGAIIVDTESAWNCEGLILKYKSPLENEYKYFNSDTQIAALFHAEGNKNLLYQMLSSGVTAYSFEFFETSDGIFPLAFPGGEIAGKIAVLHAAYHLQNHLGGNGILLCDIVGVKKPRIGIIGYGSVGSAAAKIASDLGNEVIIFGRNIARMGKLNSCFGSNVKFMECTESNLISVLPTLDALIGAILISTYDTPPIVTEQMIKSMHKGAIVIDVTCGYGTGYMPTIKKQTTLKEPTYIDDGVIYMKVDNLPSAYHLTTTEAYTKNALPYILRLANHVCRSHYDDISSRGKIIQAGKITHPVIQQHWGFYNEACKTD